MSCFAKPVATTASQLTVCSVMLGWGMDSYMIALLYRTPWGGVCDTDRPVPMTTRSFTQWSVYTHDDAHYLTMTSGLYTGRWHPAAQSGNVARK